MKKHVIILSFFFLIISLSSGFASVMTCKVTEARSLYEDGTIRNYIKFGRVPIDDFTYDSETNKLKITNPYPNSKFIPASRYYFNRQTSVFVLVQDTYVPGKEGYEDGVLGFLTIRPGKIFHYWSADVGDFIVGTCS